MAGLLVAVAELDDEADGPGSRARWPKPRSGDRRFKHDDWQSNFLYDYIKQSYLIAAKHLHQSLAGVQGLDEQTAKKVDFYTRQYIDALSPSNFVLTNPEVMRETVASGGQNLVKGFANLLEDLTRGNGGGLKLRMTDETAFKLGENIAVTPGKVVFQNDLMQLIQYAPTTEQVYERPLLIVPPWINKYYILDLREKNSFVKWAVEQGHTVFIVSWVNPDARFAGKTFEDYLNEGPLAALDAVERATGEREVNVIGFCLGGTLLATALGYLAAKGDTRVASATFFATLIDFERGRRARSVRRRGPGRSAREAHGGARLSRRLRDGDDVQHAARERSHLVVRRQQLPARAATRSRSTCSTGTRTRRACPRRCTATTCATCICSNLLAQPGGIVLNDTPIDLDDGATRRSISSPRSKTTSRRGNRATPARGFSKAPCASCSAARATSPASSIRRREQVRLLDERRRCPRSPKTGSKAAAQHAGSWWTDWARWIAQHGGDKVPARVPGDGALPAIEDAPGSYVAVRAETPEIAGRIVRTFAAFARPARLLISRALMNIQDRVFLVTGARLRPRRRDGAPARARRRDGSRCST